MRYSSDITAGSLKVAESRIIAGLLLQQVDQAGWMEALYDKNVLQARRPGTAKRMGNLIRRRLVSMEPPLWELIRDGSSTTATHACLAAAVKASHLLGDFLYLVVREEFRVFTPALTKRHWEDYLDGCHSRDPDMGEFRESTQKRLRSTIFQILAQAGYVENTRTLRLQRVHIDPDVLAYLQAHREKYVLQCIQVTS